MIFVYIILCHVKRLCYTPTLVYITLCYTMCICSIPLWYMTIYITSHIILIYYNNYYYDNYNSYLFFIFIIVLLYVCACMRVYCAVLSLLCAYVCSLMCPRICSYMCICVCLPRITLPDRAVVKRLMYWYRGGYISGKNFYKIWKMGIPGKNRPQEHFWFGKTVKTLDKTVQMCYNINIETKGDW